MNVTIDELAVLQQQQARIRNMCIMAHVDHGKTTLSDHLIASNGLIHPKMVGELRYLDSRDDEQARGITMKSSSISLLYVPGAAGRPQGPRSVSSSEKLSSGFLVNLIDSPGHVDFCSEVSTAARLSDGALVVVDAVEGVCIQTHAVLRQAWEEKVKPCLVINKLDRLILELKLPPEEAASRMSAIVAHANMIWSAFNSEHYMREADVVLAAEQQQQQQHRHGTDDNSGDSQQHHQHITNGDNTDDEEDIFQPSKGNVAFGSAGDGWAFRLDQFADMYSAKLGAKPSALVNALWGDWQYLPREKRVVSGRSKGAKASGKTMFVQFCLEPIWRAYSVCEAESAQAVLGPIVSSRGLSHAVPAKLLEGSSDPRAALKAVLRAWLPLAEAVLGMAVKHLPSPAAAAPVRMPHLLGGGSNRLAVMGQKSQLTLGADSSSEEIAAAELQVQDGQHDPVATTAAAAAARWVNNGVHTVEHSCTQHQQHLQQHDMLSDDAAADVDQQLERSLSHLCASSSSGAAPLVVFVSKMVSVPSSLLPRVPGDEPPVSNAAGEVFLAFGRVFSGVAREGARVHVLSSAYDPLQPDKQRQTAVIRGLYLMMGRALERLPSVPAGNVCALAGLDTTILKSATLSSTPCCTPLAPMVFQAAPIVRVALEPANPSDMAALSHGLKLLNRADPFVEVGLSEKGEHLLGAAGEVHLETIVKDLRERFARVDFQVSPPLVAFKESVLSGGEADEGVSIKTAKVVEATTASGVCVVRVRAHALPNRTAALLDEHAQLLPELVGMQQDKQQQQQWIATRSPRVDRSDQRRSLDGGDNSKDVQRFRDAFVGSLSSVNDKQLVRLLERAWLLGPRNVGPNIALCSPAAAVGSSKSTGSSLFDIPSAAVVKAASRHGPLARIAGNTVSGTQVQQEPGAGNGLAEDANGNITGSVTEPTAATEAAGQQLLDVVFGKPVIAAALNHSAGEDAVTSAANRAAAAADQAAQSAAVAGVGDLWPHISSSVESGVTAGFQLAAAAGPLCDESMWGVMFEIEVRVVLPQQTGSAAVAGAGSAGSAGSAGALDLAEGVYGPFSGQVMTAVSAACRRAVLEADPRLVEALYLCQVQASAEALSGVYAVLGRRRARILQEEMREGSGAFMVHAYLPVEASFGLADEMRRRSSGAASASLLLSHWERLQVDPFFVPTTEEELEEFGTEAGGPLNLARRLIDAVRRRKGLPVEEKVVAKATKQRTLKRNV